MKRMIDNAEVLEKIAKELVFNKETNTIEIGGNVEIDGNAKINGTTEMQIYFEGEIEYVGSQEHGSVYVLPLHQENNSSYQYGILYLNITNYDNIIGIGYWDTEEKSFEADAITDESDALAHFSATSATSNRLDILSTRYVNENEIPQYYEHQLAINVFKETDIAYFTYISKNNLVIDSMQDLTIVVKPNANTKLGYGNAYLFYENGVWKSSTTGNVIESIVSDNVVVVD